MKVVITGVENWVDDECQFAGDMSHEGKAATLRNYADEHEQKIENHTWTCDRFPFVVDVGNCSDEDEAVQIALDRFTAEVCEFDLIKPYELEYEIEE